MRGRTKIIAAGTIAAAIVVWSARFRVADHLIDQRLSDAHVPASYRVTRIGPFLERLQDVRIGDPSAPDLIAERIDVMLGYGLSGPYVRAIDVRGARLIGRVDGGGIHLGAIDRLLPESQGGGPLLPDLGITLRDTQLSFDTPNGRFLAAVEGSGNPAERFSGKASIRANAIALAPCRIAQVTADLRVTARSRAPAFSGPVRIGSVACPGEQLSTGTANLALSADPAFREIAIRLGLEGFGGSAGPARFAGLTATATGSGPIDRIRLEAQLALHALALPDPVRALSQAAPVPAGTPITPTVIRARTALASLLGLAEAKGSLTLAMKSGAPEVRVSRLELTGAGGARLTVAERDGIRWSGAGWQADGDVTTGGGGLPEIALALRQTAPGQPIVANGAMRPYRADDALLALAPVRLRWDGSRFGFETVALIDGPVAQGTMRGLAVPLDGSVDRSGRVAIGQGCRTVRFAALRLAGYQFAAAHSQVCGGPIVASDANGRIRIAATIGRLEFAGRAGDGATVSVSADRASLKGSHFAVTDLAASLGAGDRPTRLAIPSIDGNFASRAPGGRFEHASATIANVPLDLTEASGTWSSVGGELRLGGALRVSDASASPRFLPLEAPNAAVRLSGNRVTAHADLVEPATRAPVAQAMIEHDLGTGAGNATLAMPGLQFAPKGLQPERLTPLTLGVIADVTGTVTGSADIAWRDGKVSSSGTFATDRLDLAAAFGPVSGIAGALHFTDLLGLVSAPGQTATIAEINPGVVVNNGTVRFQLIGDNRIRIDDGSWPFAGGTLRLEPGTLDLAGDGERRLTFVVSGLDAAAFIQQLDFPNISATGVFDGRLPMIFDRTGGRIEGGIIAARPGGGSLAYVGQVSDADLGTIGKLAFDALKAIRYSSLDIALDGKLDGEIVSRVRFTGVREATPHQSLVTRLIRHLPFRFDIQIRAPFRGLVGSARAYMDPRLLLTQLPPRKPGVQPPASEDVQ